MDNKATKAFLIGYDGDEKYRLWVQETNTVICSRDVRFNEKISTCGKTLVVTDREPFQIDLNFIEDLDDIRCDSEDGDTLPHHDESRADSSVDEGPQPFSQSEFNDLVRDLGLSNDGSELLGSRLKNKTLLTPGTSFSWYRHR
ncbi:hypothetical protein AVEN_237652-1 [Araneus ventricosus]|uniref:Retroviral polymerase SH3-like domain-containing protein n=1 Tax=Araneus ventricosus TaxID=182803 RepID=A0A4Y2LDI2_ARAVE|nr:hypothetical protein AVEN_237652-1 [Araneus ventricosus]